MKIAAFLTILLTAMIGCNQPVASPISLHKFQKFVLTPDVLIKYAPEPPGYPQEAKYARVQGDVIINISINNDGIPISVIAVAGPEQLRPTAIEYLSQWRFTSVLKEGSIQVSTFRVRMPFKLR